MKKLVLVTLAASLTAGCASAKHTRTQANGATETTSIHTFLSATAIKGFSETTWDGTGTNRYSRTVKVADTSTDISSQLAPLIDSAVQAAVSAAVKGAKP